MGKNKKPFIDKKRAVKFQLVHRDQRDPLQADSDAPEMVLHHVAGTQIKDRESKQKECGIYYDDDYDYLQHLQPRGEGILISADESLPPKKDDAAAKPLLKGVAGLNLPANTLPSEYEEDEGMLEKGVLPRGPQPDWDPDIVEALDDGVDYDDPDNILEDNFILMANDAGGDEGEGYTVPKSHRYDDLQFSDSDNDFDSDHFDEDFSGNEKDFAYEETKSRFTNYSMTSSVMRRTEGLQLLDDCFEKVMEEYDDENIGGLGEDEMEGILSAKNPLVNQMIEEMNDQQIKTQLTTNTDSDFRITDNTDLTDDEQDDFERMPEPEKEKWDCESILSTHSNIYNHPKLISEPKNVRPIKLTKKLAIPVDVLRKRQDNRNIDENSEIEEKETCNIRSKNETKEEKKHRKNAVKEEKRERRVEKKSNQQAFKDEQQIQAKILASQPVKGNIKI